MTAILGKLTWVLGLLPQVIIDINQIEDFMTLSYIQNFLFYLVNWLVSQPTAVCGWLCSIFFRSTENRDFRSFIKWRFAFNNDFSAHFYPPRAAHQRSRLKWGHLRHVGRTWQVVCREQSISEQRNSCCSRLLRH